jgi:hypothetical protein
LLVVSFLNITKMRNSKSKLYSLSYILVHLITTRLFHFSGQKTKISKLDIRGITFNFFAILVAGGVYPGTLIAVSSGLDIDPMKHIMDADVPLLQKYILQRNFIKPLLPLARILLQGIVLLAVARTYVFGMITIAISAKAFHDIAIRILRHSRQISCLALTEFSRLHFLHCRLTIILRLSESLVGTTFFLVLIVGFFVSVVCTFIAVRLYSGFPLLFYMFDIAALIIIPAATNIMVTQAIQVFENGSEILALWKMKPSRKKGYVCKLRTKMLRSIRPFRIQVTLGEYTFYYLKRSTLNAFNYLCVTNAINVLLMIPGA